MSKPAIVVENLSKSYRLGLREKQHQTFRDAMVGALLSPLHRLRELRETGTEQDTFWALRDVNFEVQPGEVVGIIGRNGAGKSTLLKVLSRIVEPTSGSIRLRGRVASLLEVGTGFHPELSGRENIYMNGSIMGMRKAEIDRKFDDIVTFAEVEKFLDTPVKRYSSGMYVRLAFAVAAHLEPEILIVDEVLAVGDAGFQKKCLGKMREVSRGGGRTVLFVSHNMASVEALCTRCVWMQNGSVRADGDPSSCIKEYCSGHGGAEDGANSPIFRPRPSQLRDERFQLESVTLSGEDQQPRIQFRDDEIILVTAEYRLLKRVRGARFNLHVLTAEGEAAFSTTDCGERHDDEEMGTYRSTCRIPGRLLNRRRYSIEMSFYVPPSDLLFPRSHVLSFEVSGRGNQGPNNEDNWPGVVCPALTWSVAPVEHNRSTCAQSA